MGGGKGRERREGKGEEGREGGGGKGRGEAWTMNVSNLVMKGKKNRGTLDPMKKQHMSCLTFLL